jgi:hypothetical protein
MEYTVFPPDSIAKNVAANAGELLRSLFSFRFGKRAFYVDIRFFRQIILTKGGRMAISKQMETPGEPVKRWDPEASANFAADPKVIGEHRVKEREALPHITLKFYGGTDKPFGRYL